MKYLLLLLIPAMAWLDRQRGMAKDVERITKIVALVGLGFAASVLVGHYWDWRALVLTAAVACGYAIGWGHPLGTVLGGKKNSSYEWWEVGILRDDPWLALAIRGSFISILSLLAFDGIASIKLFIAFTVAFPLAPYLATRVFRKGRIEGWALQEYIRGGLAALILWVLSWA